MVKNSPASAGDARNAGSTPGSGRRPGEGNGSPLQCSCLETSMDRGAWWATVRGVPKPDTIECTCAHDRGKTKSVLKQEPLMVLKTINEGTEM